MKTTTSVPPQQLTTTLSTPNQLRSLEERVGLFSRLQVKRRTSKAACLALTRVELEKVSAECEIATTGIRLAAASIKTALVANSMPQIGALTTQLNAATAAVSQALTNGGLAEIATHMHNRAENKRLFSELTQQGKISQDEQQVLNSFAEADAVVDIERTRVRVEAAQTAVDALHSCALFGISQSQNIIKS